MRLNLTKLLVGLALFVVFLSCQDHRLVSPSGQRFRIKRATSAGLRYFASVVYNYNGQGQLTSYVLRTASGESFAESSPGYLTTLTYDGQGRVTKVEGQPGDNYMKRYNYTYDNSRNITSVQEYNDIASPGTYVLTNTYTLEYGTGKVPVKIINTSTIVSPYQVSVEQYTYNNGNITKLERTNGFAEQTFSATNAPNPFYGLVTGSPSYGSYSINIIEDNSFKSTNTYDSNGFLVKSIVKVGGPVDNTYTYEYEVY